MIRFVPNTLTIIRILLIGVFCTFFAGGRQKAALAVYLAASVSDVADGWIARKFRCTSDLGRLLDPLADKCLNLATLACIFLSKRQPVYLLILLFCAVKELLMIAGGFLLLQNRVVVFSDWAGKLATGCFTAGAFLALLSLIHPGIDPLPVYLLCVATGLSFFALVHYAVRFSFSTFAGRKKAGRNDAGAAV